MGVLPQGCCCCTEGAFLLLHVWNLLSVSTAAVVLQFREPRSLQALREQSSSEEPSLKVLRARTSNPYKQRCSLSSASGEAWLCHLVELSRKSVVVKLQLAMAWSRFFYFGLILVVRAWNSCLGKVQLTLTELQIKSKHSISLQDLQGDHCFWNLCPQVSFCCARQINGSYSSMVLWDGLGLGFPVKP